MSIPVVAAYIPRATDFTPKLHSLTPADIFEPYSDYAVQSFEAAFVRQLDAAWTHPEEGVFNTQGCVKIVGLSYFSKNRKLFRNAVQGTQGHEEGKAGKTKR